MTTALATPGLRTGIKLTKAQAWPLIKALGRPSYSGRTFRLRAQGTYTLNNGDLCGGGGSRCEVTFVRVRDGQLQAVDARDAMACAVTQGPQTFSAPIPEDVIIVERSWFCGQDMGYTFTVGAMRREVLAHCFLLPRTAFDTVRQLTLGAE